MNLSEVREKLADLPEVDESQMHLDRLGRLQKELQKRDLSGILLYDPINIRYATGCRNMQIWTMHNSARYCLVPAEGKATLFDFVNCKHLSAGMETIEESRPGTLWYTTRQVPSAAV
jgi:Xaa-Pro aminopeptidase